MPVIGARRRLNTRSDQEDQAMAETATKLPVKTTEKEPDDTTALREGQADDEERQEPDKTRDPRYDQPANDNADEQRAERGQHDRKVPLRAGGSARERQIENAQAAQNRAPDDPEHQKLAARARIEGLHALRLRSDATWS